MLTPATGESISPVVFLPKYPAPEPQPPSSALRKRRVECYAARLEVELFDKLARLAGTMLAVHADVLPLDRERAVILRLVECPDDLLEVHTAAPRRPEVPAAPRVAEVEMATENAGSAVECHDGVFDVNVINPIRELANELHRVD